MLYVNLDDGSVLTLDLQAVSEERRWRGLVSDPSFHETVRGISLALNGHRTDLPLPKRFREIKFDAEVLRDKEGAAVAERISAHADGVVLSLTMYLNGRGGRFRVDLDKKGRARFVPH